MNFGDQKKLAQKAEISEAFLSQIFNGQRRPSWTIAKKLAAASSTNPIWWVEGNIDRIKAAMNNRSDHGQ